MQSLSLSLSFQSVEPCNVFVPLGVNIFVEKHEYEQEVGKKLLTKSKDFHLLEWHNAKIPQLKEIHIYNILGPNQRHCNFSNME